MKINSLGLVNKYRLKYPRNVNSSTGMWVLSALKDYSGTNETTNDNGKNKCLGS